MPEVRKTVAQQVIEDLAAHIGPNVAKMAVGDFARKSLGVPLDGVSNGDVVKLLESLRPMLSVLLGRDHTDALVRTISARYAVG